MVNRATGPLSVQMVIWPLKGLVAHKLVSNSARIDGPFNIVHLVLTIAFDYSIRWSLSMGVLLRLCLLKSA